jgi:parallel beta-helix repeat protein
VATFSSASTYISKINSAYPVAGIDNDTQGFRDNFKNIKQALENTDEDLSSLKVNTVDLTNPVTDFNDNIIKRATLQDCSTVIYDISSTIQTGDVVVDYKNGSYQKFTISSGTHLFSFANLPLENRASSLLLSISTSTTQSTVINFSGNNVYNRGKLPLPATLIGENPHIFEISNDGIDGNIFVKEYREVRDYQLNVLNFTNVQTALTSAENASLYFPAGTYDIDTTLTIPSNIRIFGDGEGKTILRLTGSFSASASLLSNISGSNITFENITFDGNNNSTRTVELLSFALVNNLNIINCTIKNSTYIGCGLGGCQDVVISGCRFENNGRPIPSTVSAPALWCADYSGTTSKEVVVDGCYFLNNKWSAAYFMPVGGTFTNNHCVNNGESTIFSNQILTKYLRIENNYINGTTRSHISGSGIEVGGRYLTVKNNIVLNCASDGISLTNISNSVIEGNVCYNNGTETGYYPLAAGIGIASVQQLSTLTSAVITDTVGTVTVTTSTNYYIGQAITISGTFSSGSITGYSSPATYYIGAVNSTTSIQLTNTYANALAGTFSLVTTAGTTTPGATWTLRDQAADNIVTNNRCFDEKRTKTQVAGLLFYANDTNYINRRTLVTNNNFSGNLTYGIRDHLNNCIDSTATIFNNILHNRSLGNGVDS